MLFHAIILLFYIEASLCSRADVSLILYIVLRTMNKWRLQNGDEDDSGQILLGLVKKLETMVVRLNQNRAVMKTSATSAPAVDALTESKTTLGNAPFSLSLLILCTCLYRTQQNLLQQNIRVSRQQLPSICWFFNYAIIKKMQLIFFLTGKSPCY
jgi:hypothetical protein